MNYNFIEKLREFVKNNGLNEELNKSLKNLNARKSGNSVKYTFEEHIEAVIYSLLSNQRKWKTIEDNKENINKIFFNYNIEKIKNIENFEILKEYEKYEKFLEKIKLIEKLGIKKDIENFDIFKMKIEGINISNTDKMLDNIKEIENIIEIKKYKKIIKINKEINKIIKEDTNYFVIKLKKIKCANRSIHAQMRGLKKIIEVFEQIEKENNCEIDDFIYNNEEVKKGYPYKLALKLSDPKNPYKLINMGIALVCEYFKNIGIDIAKPDTHIKRMLGRNILGFSKNIEATDEEAIKYIKEIADKNNTSQIEVDALIWLYCAEEYGEICTKENPKCNKCVIKDYCNKNKLSTT